MPRHHPSELKVAKEGENAHLDTSTYFPCITYYFLPMVPKTRNLLFSHNSWEQCQECCLHSMLHSGTRNIHKLSLPLPSSRQLAGRYMVLRCRHPYKITQQTLSVTTVWLNIRLNHYAKASWTGALRELHLGSAKLNFQHLVFRHESLAVRAISMR